MKRKKIRKQGWIAVLTALLLVGGMPRAAGVTYAAAAARCSAESMEEYGAWLDEAGEALEKLAAGRGSNPNTANVCRRC